MQSRAAESQWCKAGLRSHSGAKQGCGVTVVQSRAAESQWCKAGLRSHSGAKQGCGVTAVQSRAAESQWCKAGLSSRKKSVAATMLRRPEPPKTSRTDDPPRISNNRVPHSTR